MAVNGGDSFGIDIKSCVSSIEEKISHDLLISPKCCISKTPVILKRHNEKAYIPDAFSIGPLHHGSPNLKATKKIKAMYLQGLIFRVGNPNLLKTMVKDIMKVEEKARKCYAEAIDYNREQFVEILVIDGCFLIELLRKLYDWKLREEDDPILYDEKLKEEDDPIFTRSCMFQFLSHDLILLENQIPWEVLEILFDLTKVFTNEKPLILLFIRFLKFASLLNRMPPEEQLVNIKDIKHFVDLLRKIYTFSSTDPQPDQVINIECIKHFVDLFKKLSTLSSPLFRKLSTLSSPLFGKLSTLLSTLFKTSCTKEKKERPWSGEFLPSATSLVESGINFKRGTSQSILEVKFDDGVLEIPPFEINDLTETVFRNLISYEQGHSFTDDRITSYAMLLDSLINTANDIDILCKNKIIDNWLNLEDAAQLFNKLNHDIYVDYCYNPLGIKVNSTCERRWPRWRAVLVRNYFITPWAFISTLAAFILLLLTLLQTVYSMKK